MTLILSIAGGGVEYLEKCGFIEVHVSAPTFLHRMYFNWVNKPYRCLWLRNRFSKGQFQIWHQARMIMID